MGIGSNYTEENKSVFQNFLLSHFSVFCSMFVKKSISAEITHKLSIEYRFLIFTGLGTVNSATGAFAWAFLRGD